MTTPSPAAVHESSHCAVARALGCHPIEVTVTDQPHWRGQWAAVRLTELAEHEVIIAVAGQAGERLVLGDVAGPPVIESAVLLARTRPAASEPAHGLRDDHRLARLLMARHGTDMVAGRAWLHELEDRADRIVRGEQEALLRLAHILDRDGTVRGHDRISDILAGW